MAKQKTNTEEEQITSTENTETQVENTETQVENIENTENKDNENTEEKEKTLPKNEKSKPVSSGITPFIDNVLKNYPDSEYLYVDTHGGCFTKDTPERIRGKAVLFKNPHYKS